MAKKLTIEEIYQFGIRIEGTCYRDSYKRLRRAANKGRGLALTPWSNSSRFHRLWGNLIKKDGKWMKFPERYRGFGAPGALASAGLAVLIRGPGIWSGELKPGAVLQGWLSRKYYLMAKNGIKPPGGTGHSFVFISYVYTDGAITGMHVADNNCHGKKIVTRNIWKVLVGANTVK